MKRTIVLVLLICSLCTFAIAETDPAIGAWYFMFDFHVYPEFKENFGDYDIMLSTLVFLEDGTIVELDNTLSGKTPTQEASVYGRWEKKNGKYNYKLLGLGEGNFTIDDDKMYIDVGNGIKMLLHKVITFNPYKDYTR